MHEIRFLCLAVSRRDGGKCIAGIDIDSRKWVRLVDAHSHGAIVQRVTSIDDITVDNISVNPKSIRCVAPFDTLRLPLGNHVGTKVQPENWELLPLANREGYELIPRLTPMQEMDILTSILERHGPLLHSFEDSVKPLLPGAQSLSHSLSLVEPSDLYWRVKRNPENPNKTQVRAEFNYDAEPYSISVTDPIWEVRCKEAGVGRHKNADIADAVKPRILLVISLGANPFHGLHYKFVAGVLSFPEWLAKP